MSYLNIREHIKDCDVLLYKGEGLISGIIKLWTGSEYSHAALVGWWGDRLMVLESTKRGVFPVALSKNVKDYHGRIELWRAKKVITKADRKAMLEFAKLEIGKEYPSVWNLAKTFLSKKDKRDKFRPASLVFCSQLVASTYNFKGHDLAKKIADAFTTPEDLYEGDMLEIGGRVK